MSQPLRLGLVGLGNIGRTYVDLIQSGQVQRVALAATASRAGAAIDGVPHYSDYRAMFASKQIDAALIATPTMLHPAMAAAAAAQGLHVLMEKPLAMSVAQAGDMIRQMPSRLRFAVMLNQRFHPHYRALYALLQDDAIGEIRRVAWTMTAWYRPDIYYQMSDWRGTWAGEGGGLLINQCVHNLDVLQWLTGLPRQVSAIAGFGKHHAIDVEDEFTAVLTYANGATGTVTASSGEAPGINQLDIIGDRGMLRFDGVALTHWRADQSVAEHCRDTNEMFGMPGFTSEVVAVVDNSRSQHAQVLQNFVDSVRGGASLATPAEAGLDCLHLANGILQSAWDAAPVALPLDAQRFERALQARIANSGLRTPRDLDAQIDMDQSFR